MVWKEDLGIHQQQSWTQPFHTVPLGEHAPGGGDSMPNGRCQGLGLAFMEQAVKGLSKGAICVLGELSCVQVPLDLLLSGINESCSTAQDTGTRLPSHSQEIISLPLLR